MATARYYSNGHRWRKVRARVLAEETHCWICGEYVDQTLPTPHPGSAEVDHVRPVAQGGDLYDRNNLRLACRRCNVGRNRKNPANPNTAQPLTTSRDWTDTARPPGAGSPDPHPAATSGH